MPPSQNGGDRDDRAVVAVADGMVAGGLGVAAASFVSTPMEGAGFLHAARASAKPSASEAGPVRARVAVRHMSLDRSLPLCRKNDRWSHSEPECTDVRLGASE